ncbi:single-stranded DNA-binding protein [Agathobaculum sp.]|uniref:single-stranded DNA-binding protein n=1 Tax=Agathobaculum sp. TaxID=2048138 RepID=UPI002A80B23F|nr:single-stranded DNA-binding protein [Agathobaculum sp.]MDY3618768.1 single-stranded DNA-binding protein [Agathobaculum sp.]
MLNKAILMGRLTRDPELRHTQSNMAVCSFSLAIDRGRKDQNGERQTDFIDCVAWGRQAEFVAQWFTKGAMAIVVGRIQSRRWQDQNGNNRTAIEVNCDEVSFGETRKSREANQGFSGGFGDDSQLRPEPAASQVAPAFDLPAGDSDFQELADDDGDVPF